MSDDPQIQRMVDDGCPHHHEGSSPAAAPSPDVLDELAAMCEFAGTSAPRCPIEPPGWHRCTRKAGHDGPCAHWPIGGPIPRPAGPATNKAMNEPSAVDELEQEVAVSLRDEIRRLRRNVGSDHVASGNCHVTVALNRALETAVSFLGVVKHG